MISLRSRLRRDLLTYFYTNRSARVYVRQLAEILGVDSTNLSRELGRLEADGLLQSEIEGRQRYYQIDPRYPYLKPVFTLLQGTVGIRPTLERIIRRVERIDTASIYGSFAKGGTDAASDIDILIVGKPDQAQLAAEMRKAEKLLRRPVNYTVLTSQELQVKLKARDPFITDIWTGRRIELIGDEHHQATEDRSEAGKAVPGRRRQKG
jgi:predicted nucleotidyltransferase